MNERLKEDLEEEEFLRKRAWDLRDDLEKRESELLKTVDMDERKSLQIRLKNTRWLYDDYVTQHRVFCREAGITQEMLTPKAAERDIVSLFSRKTLKSRKDLIRDRDIEIPPFFNVPSRNPRFTGRQEEVTDFIKRVLQGGAFAICGVKGMGGIGKSEI
ncbi:MAG: hypothetical protein GY862_14430, partial [Gammaproteobacteria bacterium]|nr:hypothetical protein [Gammaproteobacteria bacterium]